MTRRTVKVWEVSYHVPDDHSAAHGGSGGDGFFTRRFRRAADACAFAATVECYGRPAKAEAYTVSVETARRWGVL